MSSHNNKNKFNFAPIDNIHKWNGAIPSFIKIEVTDNRITKKDSIIEHIIILRRNTTEDKAWILKYLIIAFEDASLLSWNSQINPTNANKFNSIINQMLITELLNKDK